MSQTMVRRDQDDGDDDDDDSNHDGLVLVLRCASSSIGASATCPNIYPLVGWLLIQRTSPRSHLYNSIEAYESLYISR